MLLMWLSPALSFSASPKSAILAVKPYPLAALERSRMLAGFYGGREGAAEGSC